MIKLYFYIIFLFLLSTDIAVTQNDILKKKQNDKIYTKYEVEKNDTANLEKLNSLFWFYINENIDSAARLCNYQLALLPYFDNSPAKQTRIYINYAVFLDIISQFDSAQFYYSQALQIAKKNNDSIIPSLYNNMGINCDYRGDYKGALFYYNKALEYYIVQFEPWQLSSLLSNIGLVYFYLGNYSLALEYFYKSIWFSEFYGNKMATSMTLNNIAMVYGEMEEYKKAINIYHFIIKTSNKFGNQVGMALPYLNLGNTYKVMNENDSALYYYNKGLYQAKLTGNISTQYDLYIAISEIYLKQHLFDSAGFYLSSAASPVIASGNSQSILNLYAAYSLLYYHQKQIFKAKQYALLQYQYGKAMQTLVHQQQATKMLQKIFLQIKQFDSAYYYQTLYYQIKEKINTQKEIKTASKLEANYAFEAKNQRLKIAHQQEMLKQQHKQQKQQFYLYLVIIICGSLIIIVSLGVKNFIASRRQHKLLMARKNKIENQKNQLLRKNREIQLQQKEIILQRNELETAHSLIQQRNKDITDSIQYAQKIQNAFIPSIEQFEKLFPGNFILFKPKDIVSGDFYWIAQSGSWKFLAIADCTGHGVPGAFVSIVGYNLLNQALKDISYPQPYKLLNYLNNGLHELLNKNSLDEVPADGMDVTIIAIQEQEHIITIAGAKSSCIHISNNISHHLHFDIYSAGRKFNHSFTSFQQKEFPLQKGDKWYFFTDGYYDQFGGANNRKFMVKQFKEILQQIHPLPLARQKETLEIIHQDWKMQCQTEQVDDILVIGLRIE